MNQPILSSRCTCDCNELNKNIQELGYNLKVVKRWAIILLYCVVSSPFWMPFIISSNTLKESEYYGQKIKEHREKMLKQEADEDKILASFGERVALTIFENKDPTVFVNNEKTLLKLANPQNIEFIKNIIAEERQNIVDNEFSTSFEIDNIVANNSNGSIMVKGIQTISKGEKMLFKKLIVLELTAEGPMEKLTFKDIIKQEWKNTL